jgi:outer membrane protein OmpA-like peptidoglycan-associated protein
MNRRFAMIKKIITVSAISALILLTGCAAPALRGVATAPTNPGVDPNYDASKQKAVKLTKTDRGYQMTFDARVFFDTGKSVIKEEGMEAMNRAATLLKEKTTANILVEGHTDNTGSAQLNQKLSEQRADSVRAGLVSRGVANSRIESKGLGFSQPVAENTSEDGRAQNRRVEIVMLGETFAKLDVKQEEERLASGLEKFIKGAETFVRGVFDRITGGGEKKPE